MILTYGLPLLIYYNNTFQSGNNGYLTLGSPSGTGYTASFLQPSTSIRPTTITIQSVSTPTQTGTINPSQPFYILNNVNGTPYYLSVQGTGPSAVTSWNSTPSTSWSAPGRTTLSNNQLTAISFTNNGTTAVYFQSPWKFYTVTDYCKANPTFPIPACSVTPAPTPAPTVTPTISPKPTALPIPESESWIRRNLLWVVLFFGLLVIIILAFIIWSTHRN